jgi:hypothetical protein
MRTLRNVLLLMFVVANARADVLDKLKDVAKQPVKPFLEEIEKTAQNLIAQGQQVGNGLISHGGMELDAATRTAILGLGANIDKNVESLTQGEQQIILGIRELQNRVKSLGDIAYDIKDTTVIDLTALLDGLPFTHAPDFFVQSIRGTAILPQPGNYHVSVNAFGFGESSDSKAEISAAIDGNPIKFVDIDQVTQRGKAILGLPNDAIAPLFDPNKLKVITLDLKVKISRKHFLVGWKSHDYQFPVKLLLYPAQVATATVHITAPKYAWVPVQDVLSAPIQTPERDGCKYCDPSCAANNALDVVVPGGHNPPVVGDERLVSGRVECTSGSICDFSCRFQYDITANGTRLTATFSTHSHPTQRLLRGKVEQWQETGSITDDKQVKLVVDSPIVVAVPEKYSLISLDIQSFTKQKYTLVLPTNDPHGLVTAALQPNGRNLVLTVAPPGASY